MHQLIVTKDFTETPITLQPKDTTDKETIEDATPCLIPAPEEAISNEQWLNTTTTSYRAQKPTATIKSKISKVEEFSNYLVSPMRKDYRVFYGTMMVCFKVIQCWLKLDPSGNAPKNWTERRQTILERLMTSMVN